MRATVRLSLIPVLLAAALLPARMSAAWAEDPAAADSRFERLKSLAGTWVGLAGFGEPTDSTIVTYRVTAAGSAVAEVLFEGTDHEMMTVYHRDGKDLILIHYCAAGNQPRMKAVPGTDPDLVQFEFVGATNMASPDESHMHSETFRFLGPDHIQTTWTHYVKGKPVGEARFDLQRKK